MLRALPDLTTRYRALSHRRTFEDNCLLAACDDVLRDHTVQVRTNLLRAGVYRRLPKPHARRAAKPTAGRPFVSVQGLTQAVERWQL